MFIANLVWSLSCVVAGRNGRSQSWWLQKICAAHGLYCKRLYLEGGMTDDGMFMQGRLVQESQQLRVAAEVVRLESRDVIGRAADTVRQARQRLDEAHCRLQSARVYAVTRAATSYPARQASLGAVEAPGHVGGGFGGIVGTG